MDVANINQSGMAASKLLETENAGESKYSPALPVLKEDDSKDKDINPAAVYEPGKKEYNVDMKEVRRLIQESNDQLLAFRKMIETLLNKQGVTWDQAMKRIDAGEVFDIEVDEETRQKALEAISEDGYYGVKQTSERIINFAKAISGGDPSKIEMLRDAVYEGFKAAEESWGGKLPEISYQTLDAVMKGFDEWAQGAAVK